jgi:DNA-binding NarL/FixJ family response regulator
VRTAVAAARSSGEWAVAFELAVENCDLDAAVVIAGEASEDLLAAGRLETLEKWLEACGPRAAGDPLLMLAKADILFRQNKLAEAEFIALEVARSLPDSDPRTSRAWFLAGHAAYVRGAYDHAYRAQRHAERTARRHQDKLNAAWGAFAAGHVLNRNDTSTQLTTLERLSADPADLTTRLRVMTARQVQAARAGRLTGIWEAWQVLLPYVDEADPLARSCAHANIAWLHACRSDYELSKAHAEAAVTVCARYRLDFATASCLYVLGRAQLGLRKHSAVQRTLVRLGRELSANPDPYLNATYTCLAARFHLCRGAPEVAVQLAAERPERSSDPHVEGEMLAIAALAAAAAGMPARVSEWVQESRNLSSEAIVRIIGDLAELGADQKASERARRSTFRRIILEADETQSLDALVLAYRSNPRLLDLIPRRSNEASIVHALMVRAKDHTLARGAALVDWSGTDPSHLLTARERQIAHLVRSGMTNRQIADSLVISHSTAKVHVRNIMRKLDASRRSEIDEKLDLAVDES